MHSLTMSMSFFFFFNDTATTEIYTLSLHDALPISPAPDYADQLRAADLRVTRPRLAVLEAVHAHAHADTETLFSIQAAPTNSDSDRKSTRLNSSHANISYAVFCLKKKNTNDYALTYHVNVFFFFF